MTDVEGVRVVRTVLCRGLSAEQADQLARAMIAVPAEAGTRIIREGDRPEGLFVLVQGTVEVLKQVDGDAVVIATVDAPTVLGEMSLILDRGHSATVRAKTACEFRLLTRTQFERLVQEESIGAYKLVRTLAEVIALRLYRMDDKVVELRRGRETSRPVEELAAFKEKLLNEWRF